MKFLEPAVKIQFALSPVDRQPQLQCFLPTDRIFSPTKPSELLLLGLFLNFEIIGTRLDPVPCVDDQTVKTSALPVRFAAAAFLLSVSLVAQPPKAGVEPEDAAEHWKHGNYPMALTAYKALLSKQSGNMEFNYRLGICYLRTNINKKEAIKYLEIVTKQPKSEPDAWLYLGQAYQTSNRFDDAIKAYQAYKQKDSSKEAQETADRGIETCNNAKALMKYPLKVTFENLGKEVNSEYPDYYPFVTADEQMLVFTSRRKGNMGATMVEVDGYYSSDIWKTSSVNGAWAKSKNVGAPVNGNYDEQCVGLSADGKWMTVYIDNIDNAGDIYLSQNNKTFQKSEKLNENVNKGFETAGSLSPDGNIIFFSSKRDGGNGGLDLYMSRKLPGNLGWALAQNINAVNSRYDEDFPFMAPDGKTLYFASKGHNSMGGYDIFTSTWDEESNTWSVPKNLGYPINTPDDNVTISFTENNRIAYLSTVREGGMGDLDIYRVVFDEIQQESYTLVTGKILTPDSSKSLDAIITVTNSKTQEEVGTYKPVPSNGKYVLALPPGKYVISVEATGYKPHIDNVLVFDIAAIPEIKKDMLLSK